MQGMNEQICKFLSYELMLYLVHIIPFPNNSLLKLAVKICTEFKKSCRLSAFVLRIKQHCNCKYTSAPVLRIVIPVT